MTRMTGTVCAVMFNVIYTDRQILIAIHHDILGILRAILFELPHLEAAHKSPPIHFYNDSIDLHRNTHA